MIRRTAQIIARAPALESEKDARRFWNSYGRHPGFHGVWPPRRQPIEDDAPALAYINHSRWVADCPCGGGIGCDPNLPVGCCLDCGTIRPILFPDQAADIEAVLEARPPLNRNWLPGESVGLLEAENLEHGLLPDHLVAPTQLDEGER